MLGGAHSLIRPQSIPRQPHLPWPTPIPPSHCPLLPNWLVPENSQSVRTQRTQEMGQFLLHPARAPPPPCSSLALYHPGSYTLKTWGLPSMSGLALNHRARQKDQICQKCRDLSLVVQWLRFRTSKAGGMRVQSWVKRLGPPVVQPKKILFFFLTCTPLMEEGGPREEA